MMFITIRTYVARLTRSFWVIAQVHLFITACSWPFLASWGLGVSLASPIGNLIFGPVLAAFLLTCSIITIFQLLGIPHYWLIWLLERGSDTWVWTIKLGRPSWIFYTKQPPILLAVFVLCAALYIVARWPRNRQLSSAALFGLVTAATLFTMIFYRDNNSDRLIIRTTPISIEHKHGATSVIVEKPVSRGGVNQAALIYNLRPAVVKATGSPIIDHLTIHAPSCAWCQSLAQTVNRLSVKQITVITQKAPVRKSLRKHLDALKRVCLRYNVRLSIKMARAGAASSPRTLKGKQTQ
jgi:hypothetical protein